MAFGFRAASSTADIVVAMVIRTSEALIIVEMYCSFHEPMIEDGLVRFGSVRDLLPTAPSRGIECRVKRVTDGGIPARFGTINMIHSHPIIGIGTQVCKSALRQCWTCFGSTRDSEAACVYEVHRSRT